MHIQVDGSESGAELYHLSILFQSLAGDRGFAVPKPSSKLEDITLKLNIDTTEATTALDKLASHAHTSTDHHESTADLNPVYVPPVTVSTITEEFKKMPELGSFPLGASAVIEPPADLTTAEVCDALQSQIDARNTDTNLDSSGLPWDARIHAGSRERNTDGSWRVRRRPKGVEEAEWESTLARVTSELRDLMEIPVSTGAVTDAAAETALTDAEVDAFVEIVQGFDAAEVGGDTTVETVIAPPVILPPVVLPPVTITPPVIATDAPAVTTFAQLMVWLTSRTPKDEAAKPAMVTRVNEILAANGLTTLQQLGQRADLIPQVLAQFREAFGE